MWNILIVAVMIQNHVPITRKLHVIGAFPFGLSFHFTGMAIGLFIKWLQMFYTEYETYDVEIWMSRLFHLEETHDDSIAETD